MFGGGTVYLNVGLGSHADEVLVFEEERQISEELTRSQLAHDHLLLGRDALTHSSAIKVHKSLKLPYGR